MEGKPEPKGPSEMATNTARDRDPPEEWPCAPRSPGSSGEGRGGAGTGTHNRLWSRQGWVGSERGSLTSFFTLLSCFLQHLHALVDHVFQSYVLDFGPKTPTCIVNGCPRCAPPLTLCWGGIRPPLEGWPSGSPVFPMERGRKCRLSQEPPTY